MAKTKTHKKSVKRASKAPRKTFTTPSERAESPRPSGLPHHRARNPGKRVPLHEVTDNKLHFLMYTVWKGYTIARNEPASTKQQERLKYYSDGIDKIKAEMDRRGLTDKHSNRFKRHALPFPPKKWRNGRTGTKLPRYADGLWFRPEKGGTVTIISPLKIIR